MERYNQRDFLATLIEKAIKTEEISVTFYAELAHKFSRYQSIREFLESASKDKVLIKNLLSGVEISMNQVNILFSNIDNYFLAAADISAYQDKIDSLDPSFGPIDFLSLAFNFEKDSMLLYQGLRDVCGNMTHLTDLIATKKELITYLMSHRSLLEKKAGKGKLSW
jgi:hypothetical protein